MASQECRRCVFTSDDGVKIEFDAEGICSFCRLWERRWQLFCASGDVAAAKLAEQLQRIREDGRGKPYDCVMGVSGGVDSSFLACKAKEWGLRPLLVHFDNGWDSELAVKNIESLCRATGFELYTLVVDWEEFRSLQLAYLYASVVDVEVPTDHAIVATLYESAAKFNVKYILSGFNIATEGILPSEWRWTKLDLANLRAINKRFGTHRLKTYPTLSFWRYLYYQQVKKISSVQLLNYCPYNQQTAKSEIIAKLGWRDYGSKHGESIFTRFYQKHILPGKFGIDKRKAHLASLINSGQISKDAARAELRQPGYDAAMYKQDRLFVIKKFGLNEEQFEAIMRLPIRSHLEFPSYERSLYRYHERFFRVLHPIRSRLPWRRGRGQGLPRY